MIPLLASLLFCTFCLAGEETPSSPFLLVNVPMADLRQEPVPAENGNFNHDPLQESQLLYGESVTVSEEKEGWSRIEAVEQSEWTHHQKWEGYPGWLLSNSLVPFPTSGWKPDWVVTVPVTEVREKPEPNALVLLKLFLGTRIVGATGRSPLPPTWQTVSLIDGRTGWVQKDNIASFEFLHRLSPDQLRERIVQTARSMIGTPYYWGGLSQGVDCSGLVYLCYRANGIDLPRDAHEQWMKGKKIDSPQPADLVFLSSEENPDRISHVMLYAGNDKIIEGPGTGTWVHEISLPVKLKETQRRKVHFGSILK